jgi:ATP-dependent DNA ligase
MTTLLPELAELQAGAVLDGELVALNEEGKPHFPLVCQRLLHGNP